MAEKKTGLLKQYFVRQSIKEATVEDFIRKNFPLGDYSSTELQRTPLGLKVVIFTNKPGKIIGRGGKTINEMTEALKRRFDLDNLQIDVKTIENPDLDPKIVAKQIASALVKGYNNKKIGNLTLKRIMNAGAIGVEIIISGCLGGSKSMTSKFTDGFLKHCGQPAKDMVDYGFEVAKTRRSTIGVKVKIMKEFRDISGAPILSKRAKAIKKEAIVEEVARVDEKAEMEAMEEAEEKAKERAAKKRPRKKAAPKRKPKPRKEAAPKRKPKPRKPKLPKEAAEEPKEEAPKSKAKPEAAKPEAEQAK
ncbi:MAG: 30S ribosomal protein S3 [Candidatus Aenigmarchaeota archaeon]